MKDKGWSNVIEATTFQLSPKFSVVVIKIKSDDLACADMRGSDEGYQCF